MRHQGAAVLTCTVSICWTSWAVTNNKFASLCGSCSVLSFEVEGGTGRELRRTGSVTVVPPLSALPGLCALSPFGPTYQLVDAAGCVFRPSLCCVIEQDRPVRKACSGLLKGLWLTAWPDKLSQPSITDSHCLLEKEITETMTAACLSHRLFATIKVPSLCQTSNVLIAISGERYLIVETHSQVFKYRHFGPSQASIFDILWMRLNNQNKTFSRIIHLNKYRL